MQVRTSMLLTILMVAATLGPLLISQVAAEGENNSPNEQFIGNIEDFEVGTRFQLKSKRVFLQQPF